MRAWEGMGYNRRARNLQRAAAAVVCDHNGTVPDDLDDLLALPGVGPYTARAVLAFAFERDVGVVDTNAGRILARAVGGRRLTPSVAQATVDAMVPRGQGWSFGQALLDLGASVCTARTPDCQGCPLRRRCLWAIDGWPDPDPARGSAGVSATQSRFVGSDRQGRGRLISALRSGPVANSDIANVAGWPDDQARTDTVVAGLVVDGLVVQTVSGDLHLP